MSKNRTLPLNPTTPHAPDDLRTLWRARLSFNGGGREEFLFRSTDDFAMASSLAIQLLETVPRGAQVLSAALVSIERVAKLWN